MSGKQGMTPSQIKLVIFGAGVLLFALTMVSLGFYFRPEVRSMAGPLYVHVYNESDEKFRTDLVVGKDFGTLELEPGRGGMIRFDPQDGDTARLLIFRRNEQIFEISSTALSREDLSPVVFRITGAREVTLQRGEP